MKKILSLSLLAFSLYSSDIQELTPQDAYTKQKQGAIVIDVRTPEEFIYIGHAPGHINIPIFFETYELGDISKRLNTAQFEQKMDKSFKVTSMKSSQIPNDNFLLDVSKSVKNNPTLDIIIICKAGPRSKEAAKKLLDNGYKSVAIVKGGFEGEEDKKTNRRTANGWKNSLLPWSSY